MFDYIFRDFDAMIVKLKEGVVANIKLQPIDDSINILQTIKRLQTARGILQRILVDEGAVKRYLKEEMEGAHGHIESANYNGKNH
jgi:hypothetical protein